ncbi:MAG: CDP-alcohol phosphatidyltransferase family protein [Rhodobacteraceae bacterium]|jgi:phosphatidylglycerophosphate synthase|nr:CDP-alcohol phosphatidyltransferase family protein [Paracoccaceae bacterium]
MADRRPLKSRDTGWAQGIARRLAVTSVTPNRISQASMGFAALAGVALWASGVVPPVMAAALLVLGAAACQGRLLCNLFDGMVAVEGGKREADGPFWNEAPDRVADLLILAGAGLGTGQPALGFAAGAGAVLTAYVRELGRAEGLGSDFSGPMAKQHRMAVVTLGALAGAVEVVTRGSDVALTVALWVVVAGTAVTAVRRSARLIAALKARG